MGLVRGITIPANKTLIVGAPVDQLEYPTLYLKSIASIIVTHIVI
jgi:hypothetical protein